MWAEIRLLFGVVLAVSCCTATLRIGDAPERKVAMLMLIWVVTTPLQFIVHDHYSLAIVSQCAFGAGLLWLAARYNKAWLWVMTAGAASLFLIHAIFYQPSQRPVLAHVIATDAFVWGAPIFLVLATLYNRSRRKYGSLIEMPLAAEGNA
jgi:hypothetical protein